MSKRAIVLREPADSIAADAHDVDWTSEGLFVRLAPEESKIIERRFFPWWRVVEIAEARGE